MEEDELEFLQPGFDLGSLKVANLRNILVTHSVSFPSSAKKAELIQLVTDEILPKRKKLLAAQARVKRTSKGIVDVPSSQESTIGEEEDNRALMPPPQTPARGSRKTSRVASSDGADETPATTSRKTGRTPSRKSRTTKHPRESDTDDVSATETTRKVSRKSRKSELPTPAATPAVKIEEPDSPRRSRYSGENFSTDNPFQSGSSPPADRSYESKSHRRRSSLSVSREEKRKSGSRGRKTLSPSDTKIKQEDGIQVPTSSTFQVPVSRLREPKHEDLSDGVNAGEEFTPEAQLELVRERAKEGRQDLLPPQRKKPRKAGPVSKSAPWVVILTFLCVFATYWRHEKIEIGYCGVGKTSWSLNESKVPQWVHGLQPECEPCPPHAYCHANFEVKCEPDFVLKQHPLSLGGLWPLPPTCEPDSEKERRVQAVAERAIEELRERRAKWECGELVDDKGKELPKVEISEPELKREVGKKRRRGMSEQEFEELWQGALGEILSREEIITATDGTGALKGLSSTSLARIPFTCALKRSVRLTLARYRLQLGGLILLALAVLQIRSRIREMWADSARIPGLVSLTLDRLATQAALHSNGQARDGFISVGQLRDDVLRGEFSAKRREKMWKGVRRIVEDNTNVRAIVREGRSGEVSRVWEWIGETPGNIDHDDRSKSSRLSWANGENVVAGGDERPKREMEMRKWDEGRPIY